MKQIIDVIDTVETASTAGEALDAIPETWRSFIMGPDIVGEFSAALTPGKEFSMADRYYDGGYAMGRGANRLTAIRQAAAWLRKRLPTQLPE